MNTPSVTPASLRDRLAAPRSTRVAEVGLQAAVVSLVAFGGSMNAAAAPQELPVLTVEAAKETRKPAQKKKAATRPAPSAPTTPATAPSEPAPAPVAGAGGTNPNAAAGAPYKVDTSTNSKLVRPIAETPRTIVAIPKEVMEDKAATSFRELVRTTAGITLGSGEGGNPFGDRIFIRGFDARNDVFVDGQRDAGIAVRENFATEQMEILKGPSSTVAGRGTAGGAVNVETKKPFFADHYEATTTVGTDMTRRVEIDVNKKITDAFAIRADGMWQNAEVAGRDYGRDNRWGGLLAATIKPNDTVKTTVDWYHLDIDQLPDYGVPFMTGTNLPVTEFGVNRGTYFGLPDRDWLKNKQDILSAKTEVQISDNALWTNRLRGAFSNYSLVVAKPGATNATTLAGSSSTASSYRENESFAMTNDVKVTLDALGVKHTLVIGNELSREHVFLGTVGCSIGSTGVSTTCAAQTEGVNRFSYTNVFAVNFAGIVPNVSYPITPQGNVAVETKSVYLSDAIDLTDQWKLDLGARLDDYSVDRDGTVHRHDALVNWNAGLTWQFFPIGNVYAAFGTSSNPIGAELDVSTASYGGIVAANSVLAPELNKSYEIGTKWQLFDRRLLASAALFRTTKDNAREVISNVWSSSGAYVVQGVELNVAGNLTDRWSVFGGAVFMDSEVTKSANAANVGKRLGRNAHQSFNVLSKYEVLDGFTLGAGATYKSAVHGGTLAQADWYVPGGWRFDLMAEWKVRPNVALRANVNNVFDTVLYETPYENAAQYAHIAPGRVAYLSLNVKY